VGVVDEVVVPMPKAEMQELSQAQEWSFMNEEVASLIDAAE
jgi:hypothetical protein